MPAQIANGVIPPVTAPAGTKAAAAAVGEVEREAVAAKAGGTKVLAAKMAPAAQVKVAALPAAGSKAALGVGKAGAGGKLAGGKILGGPILAGKGLGLGLGLGPWGPIILGVVGAAAIYAYIKTLQTDVAQSDEEVELRDALA